MAYNNYRTVKYSCNDRMSVDNMKANGNKQLHPLSRV